ncbi:hypothetical protein V1291_004620 [Nitrobacteraceae bacterium AZCC 1564]
MTDDPLILRRLVVHIGGYDPHMLPEKSHRRFVRELKRFEKTWSAQATVSACSVTADEATWHIATSGPNWSVETRYCLLRWDDIIRSVARQPWWKRAPLSQMAFIDFAAAGALWGYLRTNWRYALFFIYPFLIFDAFIILAWLTGNFFASAGGSVWIGVIAGLLALVVLVRGPCRWLAVATLFDDWIFSRTYVRAGCPVLEQRLDVIARDIDAAARGSQLDEILVIGHSLGAVLAVDLLDRVLRLNASIGENAAPRVAFLSVGSSILKIGLHRGAKRFHRSLQRVATAPGIFWAEYQALTDVMNFYKTNPVSEMGLTAIDRPVVRIVKIRNMLDPTSYRRIRRNFYRVHNQFISGNERRTPYDYFMLVCGPLSAEQQARSPDGATPAFDASGALIGIDPDHQEPDHHAVTETAEIK